MAPPVTGTFTIVPDSFIVSSGSFETSTSLGVFTGFNLSVLNTPFNTASPPPYPRIAAGRLSYGIPAQTDLLRLGFSFGGNIISLDGNPPISFNSLPVGLLITNATILIRTGILASPETPDHFRLQFDQSTESSDLPFNFASFSYSPPSNFAFFDNGCGIHINNTILGQQTARWISLFTISGTYTYQKPIPVPDPIPNPVINNPFAKYYPGDVVEFSSNTGGFSSITQVVLTYTDPIQGPQVIVINVADPQNPQILVGSTTPPIGNSNLINNNSTPLTLPINGVINTPLIINGITYYFIIYWWLFFVIFFEPTFFWFYLPFFFKTYSGPVEITIYGTEFSGSVLVGIINILFADASGIYELVDGQTNDILYFRSGFTTDAILQFLSLDDDISDLAVKSQEIEDSFSLMSYPTAILAEIEDYDYDNFSIISSSRVAVIPKSVEIPSPFIHTAFLP